MAIIPDSTPFEDIIIPATHDSAANEDFTLSSITDEAFLEAMEPLIYEYTGTDIS